MLPCDWRQRRTARKRNRFAASHGRRSTSWRSWSPEQEETMAGRLVFQSDPTGPPSGDGDWAAIHSRALTSTASRSAAKTMAVRSLGKGPPPVPVASAGVEWCSRDDGTQASPCGHQVHSSWNADWSRRVSSLGAEWYPSCLEPSPALLSISPDVPFSTQTYARGHCMVLVVGARSSMVSAGRS